MLKSHLFILLALLCLYCMPLQAQPTVARIMVETGGSVQFRINSLTKYNDGIALEDWTRLAISFSDTEDITSRWNLEIKSMTAAIHGDYGMDLPLDYLIVEARNGNGNIILGEGTNGELKGPINLSTTPQLLIENAPQGTFQDLKLFISYRLGTEGDVLLGRHPDYYFVDIEFILSATP
ncbi:MAG: hypothetical protein ACOC12_02510 [Bacteroidota bacterium]